MTIVLETPADKTEDVNPFTLNLLDPITDVSVILDTKDQTARLMLMNAEWIVVHVVIEENVSTHLDHTSKFKIEYWLFQHNKRHFWSIIRVTT